jgi:murein DD-endopeptidase MepM/ murein hydrolase activator NlpD
MWCRTILPLLLVLAAALTGWVCFAARTSPRDAAAPVRTVVAAPAAPAGQEPTDSPAVPTLRIAPAHPRQGQALFVSTSGVPPTEPVTMTWDGKRYAIFLLGEEWRGVIPLQIEERLGTHKLKVTYRGPSGAARTLERAVSVGSTPVRIQRLRMSRTTEKLYSYLGRAQELATVRRALRTETARQQWEGSFVLPAKGRFSTPFGVKRIRNGRHVGYHRGLDIAAPTGTPIHAASAGRVVLARSLKMHGKTVVIDHGLGVTSLYLHQSALRCREGQSVEPGDLIGEIGMTGTATGPHLHWSIYVHGTAVSPLFWTKLPR